MAVDYQNALPLDFQPAPEKKPFRGVHHSNASLKGTIHGSFRGSSPESSDAHRVHIGNGAPSGVHVYRHGSIAHPSIKSRTNAYSVSGDHAIANIDGSERETWSKAFTDSFKQNVASGADPQTAKLSAMNDAEHALQAAGFTGYESPNSQNGSVVLFGDVPLNA